MSVKIAFETRTRTFSDDLATPIRRILLLLHFNRLLKFNAANELLRLGVPPSRLGILRVDRERPLEVLQRELGMEGLEVAERAPVEGLPVRRVEGECLGYYFSSIFFNNERNGKQQIEMRT